jgi:hypothetical protein
MDVTGKIIREGNVASEPAASIELSTSTGIAVALRALVVPWRFARS